MPTMPKIKGQGTQDKPWQLMTPPGTSAFEAYRDPGADPPALVVQVEVEHTPKNNRMRALGKKR
jgi:hypothetical protein